MAFSLIAVANTGGANGGTTSGIDTSGANLLVINAGWYVGGAATITISDSKGNTWNPLTQKANSIVANRLYYSVPTSVGSGHTFTIGGTNSFSSIAVSTWSGSHASPLDGQSGDATPDVTSITLTCGTVTPSQNNSLIITGLCNETNSGGAISVDSGFTKDAFNSYSGGVNEGSSIASLIQTSLSSVNPTWNVTNAAYLATCAAVFKPGTNVSNPWNVYAQQ